MSRIDDWLNQQGFETPQEDEGFQEPEARKWYLVETARGDSRAAPAVQELRNGSHQFTAGLRVIGGQEGAKRCPNAYIWGRWWLLPYSPDNNSSPEGIDARLVAVINSLLASGVGEGVTDAEARSAQRWDATKAAIGQYAEENDVDLNAYESAPHAIACLAAAVACQQPRRLLVYTTKDKSGRLRVSRVADATEKNIQERKIEVWVEDQGGGDVPF